MFLIHRLVNRPLARRSLILLSLCPLLLPEVARASYGDGSPAQDEALETSAAGVWFTDLEAAAAAAQESNKNILVDLYAEWCGWCHKLEKEVFPSPAFQKLARDFILLRVDVEDGAEGTDLQLRHGAASLPTTLLLTPRLSQIGTIGGYAPAPAYVQRIEDTLVQYEMQESLYQQWIDTADPQKLLAVAQEFHRRADGLRAAELFERVLKGAGHSPERRRQLHYAWADSLRLGGDFEGAQEVLATSRRLAVQEEDAALLEAVDILQVQLAKEMGDCQRMKAALRHFLKDHPESQYRPSIQHNLDEIAAGQSPICS